MSGDGRARISDYGKRRPEQIAACFAEIFSFHPKSLTSEQRRAGRFAG
jgi:hypothetical protein